MEIQRGLTLFFAKQALLNSVVVNKFAKEHAVVKANQTLFFECDNCIQVDDAIGWLMLGIFVF